MKMSQERERITMEKMTKNSYLFKMSVPIFIELLLQLLVGNIDQIMVSRYSQASVAAIVNGNQIMNIIIITINMLCMATTVVLTQCPVSYTHLDVYKRQTGMWFSMRCCFI